jgi:hypothetical protein
MSLEKRICPECQKEFERQSWDIKKYEKKGKVVCCSRSCSAKISNRSRYEKRTLKCKNCNIEILINQSDIREQYCSKDCYFEDQKDILAERARRVGRESAEKISQTKKEKFASGELTHPLLGKEHSQQTKRKISKKRKEYYKTHDGYWKGKKLSKAACEKMSETRTKRWINGEYKNLKNWSRGKHFFKKANEEVHYRSSWELAYMKYLDQRDDVRVCEYEKIRIPYYGTDGDRRNYIPDFLVEYDNGSKILYEVKPFVRKDSEINKRKFKAAREYCKKNNIKFKVVTERYLKHIGAMDLL